MGCARRRIGALLQRVLGGAGRRIGTRWLANLPGMMARCIRKGIIDYVPSHGAVFATGCYAWFNSEAHSVLDRSSTTNHNSSQSLMETLNLNCSHSGALAGSRVTDRFQRE